MKAVIEVIGGSMDGAEVSISGTATIGRDKASDVVLAVDRYVSKKHAVLRPGSEGYILEDLGSTNGTFIDGEPVEKPMLLSSGQMFKVGRTLLRIHYA